MLKLSCIGNLTRDPEIRIVQKGETDGKVTNFTVAASYGFGDYKRTEFIRVAAWNAIGKACSEYLRKGSKVYICGVPTVNTYQGSDGECKGNIELRADEVEFLSSKPADADNNNEETDEDIEALL